MTDPFVEYVQNPDRRRLSRFIVAYTEPVTRLVRRIVPCTEASQDVVQDVFLRLAESDLAAEKIPYPRAYVFRVALNLAREHLRAEKTRARHESEAARLKTTATQPADEDLIAREAVERLYRNIDSLPEPLRVAIHLRAVDGLSYKEIALVTGVSVGIVGSRIQKARKKLSELSGGRELAMAWANLELARKQGWFPAATDGLSRSSLARLKKAAKPARTLIVPAAIVAIVTMAALGVSVHWILPGPGEAVHRGEVATALPARRSMQVAGAAGPAANGRPEKPMAPVVAGAETEIGEARAAEPEPEGTGDAPARESEGGETMKGKTLLAAAALAVGMAAAVDGAETGDFDGDGKLTIRDVLLIKESANEPELELAPGSFDAFEDYPSYVATSEQAVVFSRWAYISASVYLESLRRTLSGPFPTYSFMHWPTTWLEEVTQEPLPADPRVTVKLLPVRSTGEDRIKVAMELTTTVPVRAFSLAIESEDGMLRVPWVLVENAPPPPAAAVWHTTHWAFLQYMMRGEHAEGDLSVRVPPATYLMTGGRYVVSYGVSRDPERAPELGPGTYRIVTDGRLPFGTEVGRYPLKVLSESQVLLADGTLVSPTVTGDTEITVTKEIETGWDEGLPPLRFDVENRRVLGKVEYRFADAAGEPVPEGEPVARGKPGDVIRFRVQVRTETPLNTMSFQFRWPRGLLCTSDSRSLNEQAGEPLIERPSNFSACSHFAGQFRVGLFLGGNWSPEGREEIYTNLFSRALEYFKPLGEWIDLWEAVMQIPEDPPLDVIPLEFEPYRRTGGLGDWVRAEFAPYRVDYDMLFLPDTIESWPERDLWEYDVRFHSGFILVEGGQPPEPPDHFIHFELEDVVVPPGGVVEVPVLARSADPLSRLRLAVEVDPESVTVEAVDTRVRNPETGFVSRFLVRPGTNDRPRSPDCPPEDQEPKVACWGVPSYVHYWDTDERFAVIDWVDLGLGGPYPGPELTEVARIVLRAAENPRSTEVRIRPAMVTIGEGDFATTLESGGIADIPSPVVPFSPAREVRGATVRIGRNGFFVRGDVNSDSSLNLTDPVSLLDHLFAGGDDPRCLDAADADDNGQVQLTDAVFLLQWLFGTGDAPPPPRECGEDPTADDVPCDRNVCQRE